MTTPTTVAEAKALALAELEAHRERKRREREAKAAADITAEDEIARTILTRREEEAHQAAMRAERERHYARREAQIEANRQAERQAKLAADPRLLIAETPARRLAKLLRQRLGDDFEAFAADIQQTNFKLLQIEIRRIPDDERAQALHREREVIAAKLRAEAEKLPSPESEEERAILERHGFGLSPIRKAELDAGAL
ncbi:hypothetical protein [Methylobacterium sp. 88A]|uniref:hypothetical protein n=1 Tax=Methylobacterium sp. 88A TaxID=1131813 RepID=UPI00037CEB78|nr:hypothetical protein [Methylobacterium sp. 88A]